MEPSSSSHTALPTAVPTALPTAAMIPLAVPPAMTAMSPADLDGLRAMVCQALEEGYVIDLSGPAILPPNPKAVALPPPPPPAVKAPEQVLPTSREISANAEPITPPTAVEPVPTLVVPTATPGGSSSSRPEKPTRAAAEPLSLIHI